MVGGRVLSGNQPPLEPTVMLCSMKARTRCVFFAPTIVYTRDLDVTDKNEQLLAYILFKCTLSWFVEKKLK